MKVEFASMVDGIIIFPLIAIYFRRKSIVLAWLAWGVEISFEEIEQ